jgi:RhtB (resistance to homoserine/threonine) family protein
MSYMFLQVFLVGILAGISPGPDFVVVMRNSLTYGRRVGVASAIGIALALIVHISYTVMGFALILQKSPVLFKVIQAAGALYLLWLGYHAVRSRAQETAQLAEGEEIAKAVLEQKSALAGFIDGFLCNVLNPKAALFFLSIFSQFFTSDTTISTRWIYGFEVIFAVGLWFVILACIVSNEKFRALYQRWQHWFDRLLGIALIYFGMKIFWSFW